MPNATITCGFCAHPCVRRHARRGLCKACRAKHADCGLPLPPRARPGPPPWPLVERLRAWLARWTPEAREALRQALAGFESPEILHPAPKGA